MCGPLLQYHAYKTLKIFKILKVCLMDDHCRVYVTAKQKQDMRKNYRSLA